MISAKPLLDPVAGLGEVTPLGTRGRGTLHAVVGFLLGAAVLILFSIAQKLAFGRGVALAFRPQTFIVPILFGGTSGALLALWRYRLRRIVERLRDQIERSRAVMEATQAGVIVVERATHRIVEANRAALELMGVEAGAVLGVECTRQFCSSDGTCPLDERLEPLDNAERLLRGAAGEPIPVLKSARKVMLSGKEYYVEAFLDLRDRKHLEAQLLQSQKLESVGRLASGIAHDFNNLLSVILGYAELAANQIPPGGPLESPLRQIVGASRRAANLTRGLLTFSRRQPMEVKPFDLGEVLQGTEKLLSRLVRADIAFTLDLPGTPLVVNGDVGQLEQVLVNLVVNANDAIPQSGRISLRAEAVDLDEAFIQLNGFGRPGPHVVISVADTGTGMDRATQERIFDPFFTTKEVGKGTGLGLSIVHGIVGQHGGHIHVYSEPGLGTTFRIYLPLVEACLVKPSRAATRAVPVRGRETILLAEDDPDIRELLCHVLEGAGYRVVAAADGPEALARYLEDPERVDLALLDVIMPGQRGDAVGQEILRHRPEARVVFMSGYAGGSVEGSGTGLEGQLLLAKPLSPSELLEQIRTLLDRPGPVFVSSTPR